MLHSDVKQKYHARCLISWLMSDKVAFSVFVPPHFLLHREGNNDQSSIWHEMETRWADWFRTIFRCKKCNFPQQTFACSAAFLAHRTTCTSTGCISRKMYPFWTRKHLKPVSLLTAVLSRFTVIASIAAPRSDSKRAAQIDWARFYVPPNTSKVISGTIFTGHMTKPTVWKHLRKPVGLSDKLEFHQHHSTMLQ